MICALRCWLSTTLVDRLSPFQRSCGSAPKFAPVTDKRKPGAAGVRGIRRQRLNGRVVGAKPWMTSGIRISHTPRPCVAARRIRDGRCSTTDRTTTFGRPLPKLLQDTAAVGGHHHSGVGPDVERVRRSGSTARLFTGRSGRLPLISVHLAPASVVLKTCLIGLYVGVQESEYVT